jgi:hypothetical protein|tara:strand:+ start:6891 stop:8720 length:1830 start_codon:yes stop_codon:yes gene_type:complete
MAEFKFLSAIRTSADAIKGDARTYISRVYNRANNLFTVASPFAQIISVLSEMMDLIMFYIEDSVVEQNIYTAQQAESIYGMSRLTGHDATRGFAATGEIEFRWKPGGDMAKIAGTVLNIESRAQLKFDANGQVYTLLTSNDSFKLEKSNFSSIKTAIIQGTFESQMVTSNGEKLQSFNINPGGITDHSKVSVSVNGELWTKHNSLYDLGSNEKAYLIKTGISGGLDVYFGNSSFGMVPPNGASIKVEYVKHVGLVGNLDDSPDLTIKWDAMGTDSNGNEHDLNEFLDVTITSSPKMGGDKENTQFTKIMTPMASKSFVLATPDNYEYFLSRYNMFSYIDAYNTTDDQYLDDDNVIYIFAVPDIRKKLSKKQDYFTIPQEEMFLDQGEYDAMHKVLEDSGQQMVTTEVVFVKPQIRYYSIDINIRYFEGYTKQEILTGVRTKISDYLLNITRRDKLPKSDIIYILEEVAGIDAVNVKFISETEETALRNGYYESINVSVVPQEPVTLETVGNGKQKYVFFKKIEDVKVVPCDVTTKIPHMVKGLDQWGDIIMEKEEVAVFRGGWLDRDGDVIEDDVLMNAEAAISINFEAQPVPRTIYTRVQAGNRKALK